VTRGFLGLTVACARCHDHKYDPIPQADYYALAGVFANTIYEEYPLVPKSVLKEYAKIEDQIDQKQKMLGEIQQNAASSLSQSLAFQVSNYLMGVWEAAGPSKKEKAQVVESRKLDYELLDRYIAYMEKVTDKYKYKEPWQAMMKKQGKEPEAKKLAEEFQENVVRVMLTRNELSDENKVIAAKALDGTKPKKRTNKPSNFVTNEDFCPGCNLQLKSMPEADTNFYTEIFQRMLSDNEDPVAMMAMGFRNIKPGLLAFRGWGLESRTGSESQAQIAAIRKDIDEAKKKIEPYYPFAHGVKDSSDPKDLEFNHRGDPFNLGPAIPRHFLSVLSKADPKPLRTGSGRAELADAIVEEPLALRVAVNRIWKGHFGTGLVDTPSNFGMTGERPANPELLEYLSASFKKNGLSAKKLHREIMLSSVYQLSSENNPAALAKDSGNRLYWRADRKRLDAEQLRDSVLAVAGNLDTAVGGPSEELSPAMLRRTVYGKVSRYKLDQYLATFDFPSPNISAEKRFVTTVPLQRLFLMNSDFMQAESEELAKRVAAEPNDRERIRKAHRIVYGREPSEREVALGLEYLKTEPLREYEERKKRKAEEDKPKEKKDGVPPAGMELSAKPAPSEANGAAAMPEPGAEMGMKMMAGAMPGARRGSKDGAPEVQYEPTAWGRYVKILLSSSEFLFID
jgi:hypothetical protein